ncbi:MAG: aminomethyltransferase [Candidatus Kentron sp. G]|nr:MAG: aminomethyltransferase [Candidatus Kentron sp. G]VFN00822.1 MAG: aminomethyltransferase [Candidatus Kentron sp. G]VFN01067.1 MAG: aminomethyltransferase [Candidatus Kentron sp. G]
MHNIPPPMTKRTPLYDEHIAAHAKMVSFAGWNMPIHYGSQLKEHHLVRRDAGIFDVSHMTVLDLGGERVGQFLRYLLANDVAGLKKPGKALYSCMLDEHGGVIDDLIIYFMGDDWFRMVVNAATRDRDLAWVHKQAAPFGVAVRAPDDVAMVAVQGPNARERVHRALGELIGPAEELGRFFAVQCGQLFVARTGYTGEDGYEIALPGDQAPALWRTLTEAGIAPIGFGARDTLRLEAGMNLYGQDMTEDTTPLESGLGWTVAFDPPERDFIGRAALQAQRGRTRYKRAGLVLEGNGVLRAHQKVLSPMDDSLEGEITSGGFSPILEKGIALARVPVAMKERCVVENRGKQLPAKIVRPPFV